MSGRGGGGGAGGSMEGEGRGGCYSFVSTCKIIKGIIIWFSKSNI